MFPEEKNEVVQLYLDDIIPNRFQPREIFDEKALKELAISIKEHGVIQPIIVRKVNDKYEIIAGERRYKASALAGLTKIPAIVRDLDDKESSKVALLENLQRRNLNPIEEARTYQKILEIDQLTQEELAKTMGKSQSSVANKLRLLTLPDEIQQSLLKEEISERHARALLNLSDANEQKEWLRKVIEQKMSVRNLEDAIKSNPTPKEEKQPEPIPDFVPSTTAFVNNQPLTPTAELPEEKTSDYGKVTIAPPIEDDLEEPPKNNIINYGEIKKEEDSMPENLNIPNIMPSVDMNKTRETAMDIGQKGGGADLDSLLNLGNPTSSKPATQFITPAEKIVKTDPGIEVMDRNSDYFKIPEFNSSMNRDSSILNSMDNNMFLTNQQNDAMPPVAFPQPTGPYTIEEATKKIKDLLEDLKSHGINLTTNEMNFEKSYQLIIKIEK